jgi:hypothetical protein
MARKSKSDRLAEIHAEALRQFDDCFRVQDKDREDALLARRFVNVRGAQWDWDEHGDFDRRMKLEVNLVAMAVERIRNEYRRNRITATFAPRDGSENEALSEACASRFRADTQNSIGREARTNAFDAAVEGGFAGMRLRAEYEKGDHQRICLEPINDAESTLYFDVNAKLKDKSDAEHAFLIVPWGKRAFKARYGEDGADWPHGVTTRPTFEWYAADVVFVAEYFRRETETLTYRVFEGFGGEVQEYDAASITQEDLEMLEATGFEEIEGRTEEAGRVDKYVMTGAKVLSGPERVAGRHIPLVPQYGYRTFIDHVERFHGLVLPAMDMQIISNINLSAVSATAAASGIEKPIFTPEQIAGHEKGWQNDHITNDPYRLINPIFDANGQAVPSGPLGFTKSPDISPAVATLIQLSKQYMSDQLGNPENAENVQPDMSGIAMEQVQGRLDMRSYGFMDQAADAERRIAEIWLSMASEIYVEAGRKLKTLSADGKNGTIEIGKRILDPKTGEIASEVDFSKADMEVTVDVGPTSASKRSAIVRSITTIMGVTPDPETQVMLSHLALMNLEGEGMGEAKEWSRRKLVGMGAVKPTKEEEQELAMAAEGEEPTAEMVAAKALELEAQAKAMTANAQAMLAAARTEETRAKTAETLAGIPVKQQTAAIDNAAKIAKGITGGA